MNSDNSFAIMGLVLFGVGLFYIIRGEATVGIKGLTKSLYGAGSLIVGGAYCVAGIGMFAANAFAGENAMPIHIGAIVVVLLISVTGYFFGE